MVSAYNMISSVSWFHLNWEPVQSLDVCIVPWLSRGYYQSSVFSILRGELNLLCSESRFMGRKRSIVKWSLGFSVSTRPRNFGRRATLIIAFFELPVVYFSRQCMYAGSARPLYTDLRAVASVCGSKYSIDAIRGYITLLNTALNHS